MKSNPFSKENAYNMETDMQETEYKPVLCIPRVRANIPKSHIWNVFEHLHMGILERIDVVHKQTERGDHYNRVFVHYRKWNDSENTRETRERLRRGMDIKVIHDYDAGFHWKISAYRDPRLNP
ncbi:MAG: hypothetical protein ACOVRN_00475 [Flavobacterium sp.]